MRANPASTADWGGSSAPLFLTRLNDADDDADDQADMHSEPDCRNPLRGAVDHYAGQHAEKHSVHQIDLRLCGLSDHAVIIATATGTWRAASVVQSRPPAGGPAFASVVGP